MRPGIIRLARYPGDGAAAAKAGPRPGWAAPPVLQEAGPVRLDRARRRSTGEVRFPPAGWQGGLAAVSARPPDIRPRPAAVRVAKYSPPALLNVPGAALRIVTGSSASRPRAAHRGRRASDKL